MNYQAMIVKPEDIENCWPFVTHYIDEAVKYSNGELTNESMKAKCKTGEMILLVIVSGIDIIACFTYEIRKFDTDKRALFISTISGHHMRDWIGDMAEVSNNLAKMLDCNEIYAIGRRGWGRVIKDLGYNEIHTVYSREVH